MLRINFFLDPPEPLPYRVEFEFLLSSLCRQVDEGLYEIEPDVRSFLLEGLTREYGTQRLQEISTLLWQYIEHYAPWSNRVGLERAQQLTALNFLDSGKASKWLDAAEIEITQGAGVEREWYVVMRQSLEQQTQLVDTQHLEKLETPQYKDFFISYSQADQIWGEWITWILEEAGYSVVIQARDCRPGSNFVQFGQNAVAQSNRIIAVLSPTYLNSDFTQPEWQYAIAQYPNSPERKLIPVRVRDCEPEGLLAQIAYVDLVGLSRLEAKQTLLTALKYRGKPEESPIFPRDVADLIEILNPIGLALVKQAYLRCMPESRTRKPDTLEALILRLADIPGIPGEVKPLFQCLECLIQDPVLASDQQQSLLDWLQGQGYSPSIFSDDTSKSVSDDSLQLKDFLISYIQADKAWAKWIAWTLEEAGYTVVIQNWAFHPGENFILDMQQAVATTAKTIAVLSETYLQSVFTKSEWELAFAADPESLERKLLPIRVEDCQLTGILRSIVYVDLVGLFEAEAKQAVLAMTSARAYPKHKPAYPAKMLMNELCQRQ